MNGFPHSHSYNGQGPIGKPRYPKELLAHRSDVVITRSISPGPLISHDTPLFIARNMNEDEGIVHANFVRTTFSESIQGRQDDRDIRSSAPDQIPIQERESISTSLMPWFHSNVSREATERYLHSKSDGTFLVRQSTNFPGDFTLSMTYRGKVEHYRIYQAGGQLTCDNEEFFSNLTQLVSHYKRDADGLCHRLVTPIICESYRIPTTQGEIEDRTMVFRKANLVIPTIDLQLGDIIGHGEFGDVLLGVYKERQVAVKVSKRTPNGTGMLDCLLDEAKFMVGVSHRNLVTLVGVVLDDLNVYMVTEYMANGNLVDLLRSRGRHQLEREQLLQFATDICKGMVYLEECQIVHRDLAARNVLLDEEMVAKVSDFGLAKKAHAASSDSSSGKFPIKWTAPEALRHSKFSTKSDVWSFAVLLWEIFSFGRVPYPRIPIQDVVRHIERGYRMEAPEGCPPEVTRIMHEAWVLQPAERPSFTQILSKLNIVAQSLPNNNSS